MGLFERQGEGEEKREKHTERDPLRERRETEKERGRGDAAA